MPARTISPSPDIIWKEGQRQAPPMPVRTISPSPDIIRKEGQRQAPPMPVHTISPGAPPFTRVFRSAQSLPPQVWDIFEANAVNSNIMYAHIRKRLVQERSGQKPRGNELWIICWSNGTLDFILSCTDSPMGSYPVFIFSPHPFAYFEPVFMKPRILNLVLALSKEVTLQRVFSVFGPKPVAKIFSELWTAHTRIPAEPEPYYAALLTYCTRSTFTRRLITTPPGVTFETRMAVEADTPDVSRLCYGFASESAPFTLTPERATEEAIHLIGQRQVWVLLARKGNSPRQEVVSIVAATRTTPTTSAITKVFTCDKWRSKGCAEHAVREVTWQILRRQGIEKVALYVAHNNYAARKVYHRVGFVGLEANEPHVEGVDPWIELGFDKSMTTLGHW